MPTFITITTTPTLIKVLFNDLQNHEDIQAKGATFKRAELIECWHNDTPVEHLKLIMDTGREWPINITPNVTGMMPVTSVDGVEPTTIEELHTEINKLFI